MPKHCERSATRSRGTTTREALLVACTLWVAWVQPAGAATVVLDAERNGDVIDIHASAVLNADAATAWRVLTDYDRYPEFIPDLRESRVVARRDPIVTVEQSGDAALWQFKFPLHITFEIRESPPNGLQSRAVAGSLRSLLSSYALTPVGPSMRLDYIGHVAPGFALFGPIEQTAVERNIARQFEALANEIERQSAATHAHPASAAK